MMHRIKQDWYSLVSKILKNEPDADSARLELKESLLSLAPLFAETPYFMSEEFSFSRLLPRRSVMASTVVKD